MTQDSLLSSRFTDRTRKVFDLALRESLQLGHHYIAPEHVLLAIIREGENVAAHALSDLVPLFEIRSQIIKRLATYTPTGVIEAPVIMSKQQEELFKAAWKAYSEFKESFKEDSEE